MNRRRKRRRRIKDRCKKEYSDVRFKHTTFLSFYSFSFVFFMLKVVGGRGENHDRDECKKEKKYVQMLKDSKTLDSFVLHMSLL